MLCTLAACAFPPASAALRAHVLSYHGAAVHHRRGHHVRCHARPRTHSRGSHARHASVRSGRGPHGHRSHGGCVHHHLKRRHHSSHGHSHVKSFRLRVPASGSSGCADADLTPTAGDLARVRAATLCLVNHERATQGESPLAANGHLEQAAQGHCDDMAAANYFGHVGSHGDTPLSRMRASGYIYSARLGYEIAENIGWGTLWLATPRAMVSAWMGSPEHRANILGSGYRDTGIGVSPHAPAALSGGQAGAIYTQDFGILIKA